jgi:predicted nucleic acid-binding protein
VPVLVPDVVLAEVGGLDADDPVVKAVQQSQWMRVVSTPAIPDVVLVWDLDAGESAVLAVALDQPGSMVILDDQPARRCARVLNIPTQGTLGLVLVAKQQVKVKADTHSSEGDWGVPDTRLSAGRTRRQSDTHLLVA